MHISSSEVTQPRRSRVRILTNKAAMVGKMIRNKEIWSKEALRSGLKVWRAHRPSSEADPSLFGSMGWTGKNKGRRRRKLSLGLLNVFPYPLSLVTSEPAAQLSHTSTCFLQVARHHLMPHIGPDTLPTSQPLQ